MRSLLWVALLAASAHADPSADDIAKTIVLELGQRKAGLGVAHRVANLETKSGDAQQRTRELKAALAKRSLKLVDEHVEDGVTWIVVEGKRGARARIELGPTSSEIWIAPMPVTGPIGSSCVAVPDVTHAVRDSAVRSIVRIPTRRLADVDGDAILDAFVPVAKTPHDCPEKLSYRVFAIRGTCGHELGVVGSGRLDGDLNLVAVDASNFKPIVMASDRATSKTEGVLLESVFAMKAGGYALQSQRSTAFRCHKSTPCIPSTCKASP